MRKELKARGIRRLKVVYSREEPKKPKETIAEDGRRALPGSISPRASAIICMVEAVPIKEQAPQEGQAWCL